MSGDRCHIHTGERTGKIDRKLPETLYHIDMEQCLALFLCDFFDRLDRTGLVVHVHHRDQDDIIIHRLIKSVHIEDAAVIDRQQNRLKAFFSEPCVRLQHSRMFDRAGQDLFPAPAAFVCRTEDGRIVRLRAAGREEDFFRRSAQCVCDLSSGGLHILFCRQSHPVQRRRVAVIRRHDLHHQIDDKIIGPCGRTVIQIYVSVRFVVHCSKEGQFSCPSALTLA